MMESSEIKMTDEHDKFSPQASTFINSDVIYYSEWDFFLNLGTTNIIKVLEALSDEVSIIIFEIIRKYTKNNTNDMKHRLHLTYK